MNVFQECRVAIIGGGFSGLAVAYHLFHGLNTLSALPYGTAENFNCVLIEPRSEIGTGVAYQTKSAHHLLNVRAKAMSINDLEPDSFSFWLREKGRQSTPDDFASRVDYHHYLNDSLASKIRQTGDLNGVPRFRRVADSVESLSKRNGKFELTCTSGAIFRAGLVVFAIGNVASRSKLSASLSSPWDEKTYRNISQKKSIAIVGAGLTSIDIVLEAESRGFAGSYSIISRHAQFPHTNGKVPSPIPDAIKSWASDFGQTPASLHRRLKSLREAIEHFENIHAVIDSLRPYTQAIWRSFTETEQRRFTRHLRSYWDIHRHRAPEITFRKILELKDVGRLKQVKGKLLGAEMANDRHRINLMDGEGNRVTHEYDVVVNGMGLCSDIHRADSALLTSLLQDGLLSADSLGIGIRSNDKGQIVTKSGAAEEHMYTLGSLRRGELWESIAVPELSVQARLVAESILLSTEDERPASAQNAFGVAP